MKGGRTHKDRRKRRIEKLRQEGRLEAHSGQRNEDRHDGTQLDHYEPKKDRLAIAIRKLAKSGGPNVRRIAKALDVHPDRVRAVLDERENGSADA